MTGPEILTGSCAACGSSSKCVSLPRHVSCQGAFSRVSAERRALYKGCGEHSSSSHLPTFPSSLQSLSFLLRFHSTVCFRLFHTALRAFIQLNFRPLLKYLWSR